MPLFFKTGWSMQVLLLVSVLFALSFSCATGFVDFVVLVAIGGKFVIGSEFEFVIRGEFVDGGEVIIVISGTIAGSSAS
ncbi:hypothetical protein F8M41_015643 [Gigaspora margarita]|uniref:Uncharacterized protein n=1 Tax=Gigaspora margarita TaxID=4874 RepID=A0A8H4EUS5_GIGMA|nr:hypothetical protein F8M41_015643 [Gigaspora margarita]